MPNLNKTTALRQLGEPMIVQWWRIALLGESGKIDNQPALALMLKLRCRVCSGVCEALYSRKITPPNIRDGSRGWFGGPYLSGWSTQWFDTGTVGLAALRFCDECGAASVIPPRQREALIAASNAAMSAEWLREAVDDFEFETKKITDNQHPDFIQEVFVAKAGIKAIDWVPFELAPV
jgi:hypothetical protein